MQVAELTDPPQMPAVVSSSNALTAVEASLPQISPEWVRKFTKALEAATWKGPTAFVDAFSKENVLKFLQQALRLLVKEPTLIELKPEPSTRVVVVGDTHGQFHDILRMFETAGEPSDTCHYVLNGDFVDRGAWGLEVVLTFLAWKLAVPHAVTLLRGNHETTTCTTMYGFKVELGRKFEKTDAMHVYQTCKKVFSHLPLAATISGSTLVVHGGLFRKPTPPPPTKNKRKRKWRGEASCVLGDMEDLRKAHKGGLDPNGKGSTLVATDILWSDPVTTQGLKLNVQRGIGVVFGPDITERFLRENSLKLILRSHEGPDARFDREDLKGMGDGWTLDHSTPAGDLYTVFSAPDYPQFQSAEEERHRNKAAVAVLSAPTWSSPEMVQFEAVLPRPPATACYEIDLPGSDDEMELLGDGSDVSQLSADCTDDEGELSSRPPADQEDPDYKPTIHSTETPLSPRATSARKSSRTKKSLQALVPAPKKQDSIEATPLSDPSNGLAPVAPLEQTAGKENLKAEFLPTTEPQPSHEHRRSRRLSLKPPKETPLPKATNPRPRKPRAESRPSAQAGVVDGPQVSNTDAQPMEVDQPLERLDVVMTDLAAPSNDSDPIPTTEILPEATEALSVEDPGNGPSDQLPLAHTPPEAQTVLPLHTQPASNEPQHSSPPSAQKSPTALSELRIAQDLQSTEPMDTDPETRANGGGEPSSVVENAHAGASQEQQSYPVEIHAGGEVGEGLLEDPACTPESPHPPQPPSNPGREMEQAAAMTLAKGGLQNLSDTPEPAYLQGLVTPFPSHDLELCLAPTGKETSITPEFGKPAAIDPAQGTSPKGKDFAGTVEPQDMPVEGIVRPQDTPIEGIVEPQDTAVVKGNEQEGPAQQAEGSENGHRTDKPEILKTRHKTKLPWR